VTSIAVIEQIQSSSAEESKNVVLKTRYILKVGTTADCVVLTETSQLVVGTQRGRLVMFSISLLDEGRCIANFACRD